MPSIQPIINTIRNEVGESNWIGSGADILISNWLFHKSDQIFKENLEWVLRTFFKGYLNRPSIRISNPSLTRPDYLVNELIVERLGITDDRIIRIIKSGHRLSMSSENALGLILEEYIATNVLPYGWTCCWGNCANKVDFCSNNFSLLQVKNRSNSENSASSSVRRGTSIIKWHRMNDRSGMTYWPRLNEMIGNGCNLSEDGFRDFALALIRANPSLLHVSKEDEVSISTLE